MQTIPGGKAVKHCNEYVSYKGEAGGYGGKYTGVADGGKNLGRDAINVISGTKITNKMLSPGPRHRKHS